MPRLATSSVIVSEASPPVYFPGGRGNLRAGRGGAAVWLRAPGCAWRGWCGLMAKVGIAAPGQNTGGNASLAMKGGRVRR